MGLKVAIIGLSPSHDAAPWDDPEWQRWGVWRDGYWAKLTRCFEIHTNPDIFDEEKIKQISDRNEIVPVVTQESYPSKAVFDLIQREPTCSIAYMLGMAIFEGMTEISLFGVDVLDDGIYASQRECLEYLIGFARGRGIKVSLLADCPLCKYTPDEEFYPTRYGFYEHN